jgi:hypothetical protein
MMTFFRNVAPMATAMQRDARLGQCNACPNLKLRVCTKCGCAVDLKTSLAGAACPVGKWGPIDAPD